MALDLPVDGCVRGRERLHLHNPDDREFSFIARIHEHKAICAPVPTTLASGYSALEDLISGGEQDVGSEPFSRDLFREPDTHLAHGQELRDATLVFVHEVGVQVPETPADFPSVKFMICDQEVKKP
ncbi:MAG: hypothetical protein KJ726_06790, partial [Verrucomicrobia bacterium]|nr:hypothetical protein [Verrucomicrobiota bacterium]